MKTPNEIVQDATSNKDTANYNLLELHLYLVIKQILIMYFNNQISKEQAKNIKEKAVKKYELDLKQYEFERHMFREHIETLQSTEDLRTKLRKIIDKENTTEEDVYEGFNIALSILKVVFRGEF